MKALLAATLIGLAGLCEAHTACAPPAAAGEPAPERAGLQWVSMQATPTPGAVGAASPTSPTSPTREPATPPRHLPLAGLALMVAIALRRHGSAW